MDMVFNVNTDSLDAMVTCLLSAKTSVDSCTETLKKVTSHNDWNCKERSLINEKIDNVKTGCNSFAIEYESYANDIKKISQFYNDLVTEEIKSGMEVDSKISELLSLLSGTATFDGSAAGTGDISSNVQSIYDRIREKHLNSWTQMPRYQRHVVYNINQPISITDISTIEKGLGER